MPASQISICEALAESGTRYRKEALAMPRVLINDTVKHMTVINGLRGKEVEGYIDESGNYKPYKTPWNPAGVADLKARTLETRHLQYEAEFDPEPLLKTIYSKPSDKIPMITQAMVRDIAVAKMAAISEGLNETIWQGVYDADATTNLCNFDGFKTIIEQEKTAGNIALSKGNYMQLGGINRYNAGVKLQLAWNKRSNRIKRAEMFVEEMIILMYTQWYQDQNFYNANATTDSSQEYLIGTDKKCHLVSCEGMSGMGYVIITDGKKNMRVGLDGIGTGEEATGEFRLFNPGNPKVVAMFTDCWMGVNFTSVDARFLMTASYNINDDSVYATVSDEEITISTTANTSKTATVKFQGYNLTSATAVTISGSGLSVSANTVSAASANAEGGATLTITFTGAAEVEGTLRFTNATDDIDLTVAINGVITES
jgi:hypothetical protein